MSRKKKKSELKKFIAWLIERISTESPGTPVSVDLLNKILLEWQTINDIFND